MQNYSYPLIHNILAPACTLFEVFRAQTEKHLKMYDSNTVTVRIQVDGSDIN
jgi:hypothetical protein